MTKFVKEYETEAGILFTCMLPLWLLSYLHDSCRGFGEVLGDAHLRSWTWESGQGVCVGLVAMIYILISSVVKAEQGGFWESIRLEQLFLLLNRGIYQNPSTNLVRTISKSNFLASELDSLAKSYMWIGFCGCPSQFQHFWQKNPALQRAQICATRAQFHATERNLKKCTFQNYRFDFKPRWMIWISQLFHTISQLFVPRTAFYALILHHE